MLEIKCFIRYFQLGFALLKRTVTFFTSWKFVQYLYTFIICIIFTHLFIYFFLSLSFSAESECKYGGYKLTTDKICHCSNLFTGDNCETPGKLYVAKTCVGKDHVYIFETTKNFKSTLSDFRRKGNPTHSHPTHTPTHTLTHPHLLFVE